MVVTSHMLWAIIGLGYLWVGVKIVSWIIYEVIPIFTNQTAQMSKAEQLGKRG